jgi:hypothetical protein
MVEYPTDRHLGAHHRETLQRVFQHPTPRDLSWREVLSLLEAVGEVQLHNDDRYHVKFGDVSYVFTRPNAKALDVETVVDLRHALSSAGLREI